MQISWRAHARCERGFTGIDISIHVYIAIADYGKNDSGDNDHKILSFSSEAWQVTLPSWDTWARFHSYHHESTVTSEMSHQWRQEGHAVKSAPILQEVANISEATSNQSKE